MLKGLVFAAVVVVLGAASGVAAECPIESLDIEQVESALEAAPSCAVAYRMMNACRRNSSGDVGFARIVIEKCERSFVTRGQSPRMKAYADERAACAKKYAGKQGTMYASFQATCEAGVAAKYAR